MKDHNVISTEREINRQCAEADALTWRMERVNALPDSFSVEILCGSLRVFVREIEGGTHRVHETIHEATVAGQTLVDALNEFGAMPPPKP